MRLVEEAVTNGASLQAACREAEIADRTIQRWRKAPEDGRALAKRVPANRLSVTERSEVLSVVNSPEFRDLSPKQIVPRLADRGQYLASESTVYRILRAEGQLQHREAWRPPSPQPPRERVASGPNQVWSWDITYLKAPVRGTFFYLYLVEDIWSRKIVGWAVHDRESHELAAALIASICREENIDVNGLVLHSDNGGPMKGATMLATLQRLGIVPSFSRPGVSDDNPYSEALFRTLKFRPGFPTKPFASLDAARTWVATFVRWYNEEHFHSGIRFVTPAARHIGADVQQLAERHLVYQAARARRPTRWSGKTRNWSRILTVVLRPEAAQPPHNSHISRSEEGVKGVLVGEELRLKAARGRRSLRPDERRLSG